MAYSSPTIIYKLELLNGFVSVCDVSGTYAVQTYRLEPDGRTSLLDSEVWSDCVAACICAAKIHQAEIDATKSDTPVRVLIDIAKDKLEDIKTGISEGIYDDPCIEEVKRIESAIKHIQNRL